MADGTPSWDDLDRQHGTAPPQAEAERPRGWGEAIYDTAAKVGRTADDAIRATADTLSFGLLDRALGEDEIKKTQEARERSPYATFAGDVGGAVITPGMGVVGGAISRGLGGAGAGLVPALARAVGYGVEGGAVGAGQAAGHTYKLEDLPENLKTGSLLGAIGGAVTGPLARVGRVPRAQVPSTADLFERGGQQLDRLSTIPTDYNPQSFYRAVDNVADRLTRSGINPTDAPVAHRAFDIARSGRGPQAPGDTVVMGPGEMAAVWRRLSDASALGGAEGKAAYAGKQTIRDFMDNPANVVGGTRASARDASQTLQRGNANWAAGSRASLIEDANDRAVRGAASAHSGLNFENTARQQIKNILNKKGADPLLGYTAPERQAVEDLVRRSTLPEYTRQAGNLLGGGGGLGSVVAGGVAGGAGLASGQDPQTAAMLALGGMAAGRGLRVMGNRGMAREIGEATDVLRQRSPLFLERQAATPGTVAGPGHAYTPTRQAIQGTKDAIAYELMRQQRDRQPQRITVTPRPGYYQGQ